LDAARLIDYFKKFDGAAVAFSGGVDSSVVAAAAYRALHDRALAVTVASELVPESDILAASEIARTIGIKHHIARVEALGNEAVAKNPPDRCYHCKSDDFGAIRKAASGYGISDIFDGTNHDDASAYRPGLKALSEMGIRSPLRELKINKAGVRKIAAELGLPNSERPSSPCLASRFPYGTRITKEAIARVAAAEEFLRAMGFKVLRVRDHGGIARIEVEKDALPAILEAGEKIVAKLRSLGYNYVVLDLEGFRSGSMDINLGKQP